MARHRTIKPEFWSSEQVMECSTNARLMFIGMWNFADDAGRLPNSPKTIKAQIFPGDEIALANISGMIAELAGNGLLLPYEVDGKAFLQVTGWHHQRIDKPQPARHPPPPKDRSRNTSKTDPGTLAPEREREGKGVERKNPPSGAPDGAVPGKLQETSQTSATVAQPADPKTADADLFERGKAVLGKSAGGVISNLKKHFGGNVALARAAIEQASTKQNPAEYVGAIIRGQAGHADLVAGLWDKGL